MNCFLGFNSRKKLYRDLMQKNYEFLIAFDVDDFSFINFMYSESTGNRTLKELGKRIKTFFWNKKPYRLGDKFVILFTKTESLDKDKLINKAKSFIEKNKITPFKIAEHQIFIQITVGFASGEKMLEKTELAIKLARKQKKEIMHYEDKEIERIHIKKDICNIITKGEIMPVYQPIANKDKKIIKYEALCRISYNNKIFSPFAFLEISKEFKLYNKITKAMLLRVTKDFLSRDETVSINLGYDDIIDPEMNIFIIELIKAYPNRNKLSFEIIESEEIKDYQSLQNFIDECSKYGISFSLDDFGVGYSNFSTLKKLKNIENIKIDGEFIKNYKKEEKYRITLNSIIDLAKKIGKSITAEYIEDEETFSFMKELGVDYYQGYYIGKPTEFSDLTYRGGTME